jgi:bifunctional isochorismate lyase/aryl carrier protein
LKRSGRDQLLIAGIYGHIGCLMTACHAFMQEVQPFLVADAIADFSAADHAQAMEWAAARCAVVRTVAETLADLRPAPLSRARVAGDVLGALGAAPAVLAGDDDLMDLGLDSIAVMGLLTTWREAGADVSFEDLAEVEPTLDAWWPVIEARLRAPVSA